jgi:hypothetical protein
MQVACSVPAGHPTFGPTAHALLLPSNAMHHYIDQLNRIADVDLFV